MKSRYNAHQVFERANRRRAETMLSIFLGTGPVTTVILGLMLWAFLHFAVTGGAIYTVGVGAPATAIWLLGLIHGRTDEPEPLNTYDHGIGEFEAKQLWQETISRPSLNDIVPVGNMLIGAYIVSVVCFGIVWMMNGGTLGSGEAYVRNECFSAFLLSMGYLVVHSGVRMVLFMNIRGAWKKKEALKSRLISQY